MSNTLKAKTGLAAEVPFSRVFQLAIDGDDLARQDVIGKYRALLRLIADRYARRVFRARYDESDVVQMTCMEAFASFDDFRGSSQAEFSRWVEVIFERNIYRLWRQHTAQKRDLRREVSVQGSPSELSFAWNTAAQSSNSEPPVFASDTALLVAISLQSLPESYRIALELRFIEGLKLRDIALQMDTSVGAVAGYLRRGLDAMKQQLPQELRSALEGSA